MKEYEAVSQRDNFLAKEMEDLIVSIESLRKLMIDLKEKIDVEFKEGIKKINVEFDKFFSLMFDGGTGYLDVVIENKKNRRGKGRTFRELKSPILRSLMMRKRNPNKALKLMFLFHIKKSKNLMLFLEAKGHLLLLPFFLPCLK